MDNWLERELPPTVRRWEWLALSGLALAALMTCALGLAEMGFGWDTINHHLYLGWTATQPRLTHDVIAPGYQAFIYPYLYWPAYALYSAGADASWAAAALTCLHAPLLPAVWMICRSVIPGTSVQDLVLRAAGMSLCLASAIVLSLLSTTANDLLAAIPFVWSMALGLNAVERRSSAAVARPPPWRQVAGSGMLLGVAVAFKLSQGPIALAVPIVWLAAARGLGSGIALAGLGGACTLLGAALAYAPWGWQVARAVGNPIYPFYQGWYEWGVDMVQRVFQ